MKNNILWFDETKIERFGLNATITSGGNLAVKHGGGSIMLADIFQQQGLGD